MPPRSTATSRMPASASATAACDDRLSVRQTTITGPVSCSISATRLESSGRGTLRAPSICPSGPANSSGPRTSRINGHSPRPSRCRSSPGLNPNGLGCYQTRLLAAEQPSKPIRHRAASAQIDGVFLQQIERHDLQCRLVRRGETHFRRLARVERLFPARRAQTPAIARLQPRKPGGRERGREVVTGRLREREETRRRPGRRRYARRNPRGRFRSCRSDRTRSAAWRSIRRAARRKRCAGGRAALRIGTGSIGHDRSPALDRV